MIQNQTQSHSDRHRNSALAQLPSFVHWIGFCYFPCTFFVGPLIPYATYAKYVNSTSLPMEGSPDTFKPIKCSLQRFAASLAAMVLYVVGSMYWPLEYLQSTEFLELSLFWKLTAIALVTKFYMYKYILAWLLSESACILSGITYNGLTHLEYVNINWLMFECSPSFTSIIKSYNVTTNQFAFKYIYRRLKFLGNQYLSQLVTLTFLSVWHGFESGYHVAFSNEVLLLYFEKYLSSKYRIWKDRLFTTETSGIILWLLGRIYSFYFLGYCFVPFMFLYVSLWYPILASIYFIGHVSLLVFLFGTLALKLCSSV